MNPLKSEMKIGMLNTLGADIEDIAEKLEQQEQQLQGGVAAARQASFAIGVLFAHLDRDAQEGKFADITTPEAAVELARTWLNKAVEAVNGVRSNMEASRLVTTGKAQAMRETVGRLKKDRDDEEAKLGTAEMGKVLAETAIAGTTEFVSGMLKGTIQAKLTGL